MTRSSKTPNGSQPRSHTFGMFSAVAAAVVFLFLYLLSGSLAGNPPPLDPQGSWKQVHRALGISPGISPHAPRKSTPIKDLPVYNLPLRLADPVRNPQPPKDKPTLLQDFAAALRSISGSPNQRQ